MAKSENNKKVPGALIVVVVVIIAIAAFVPTVYMPYKNKKPTMDAEHQEALDTIAYYDQSIENQDVIEADIAKLTEEWERYRKDMFVEPESTLEDLNNNLVANEIEVRSFEQSDAIEDESGTVTAEGNPLYYVTIKIDCLAEREQLIKFLKYVEEESVGAYYVRSLDASPEYVYDSDSEIVGEPLSASMEIYLYYFNQNIVVQPEIEETDTETAM